MGTMYNAKNLEEAAAHAIRHAKNAMRVAERLHAVKELDNKDLRLRTVWLAGDLLRITKSLKEIEQEVDNL